MPSPLTPMRTICKQMTQTPAAALVTRLLHRCDDVELTCQLLAAGTVVAAAITDGAAAIHIGASRPARGHGVDGDECLVAVL